MYFCRDCGSIFQEKEDLAYYFERGEFWGSPYSTKEYMCPNCKGDVTYIENKNYHTCDHCGEPCVYNYIETADGHYYCEACYEVTSIDD